MGSGGRPEAVWAASSNLASLASFLPARTALRYSFALAARLAAS